MSYTLRHKGKRVGVLARLRITVNMGRILFEHDQGQSQTLLSMFLEKPKGGPK